MPEQTSGFGAYSLTYLGIELSGLDAPRGGTGRFWTHYSNSSEAMRAYAQDRGVPATPRGDDDRHRERSAGRDVVRRRPAVIRTTAAIGEGIADHASGHLRYVTKVGDGFVSGRHAFTAGLTAGFEIPSCEFLEAGHDA